MSFLGLLLSIFLLTFRPQDFAPGFMGNRVVFYSLGLIFLFWIFNGAKKDLFKTSLDKFVIFFLTWCVISSISTHWLEYIYTTFIDEIKILLIYLFITTFIDSIYRFKIALWFTVGCIFLVAAMGILQSYGVDITGAGMLWASDKQAWQIRGAGNYNNPNDLAYSVVLIVPFALGAVIKGPSLISRFLSSGLLVTALYSIYLTRSRGGLLALATCLTLWLIMWIKSPGLKRIIATIGTIGLVTVFVLKSQGYRIDASAMGRVEAWAAGMDMLRAHPLFGVGKGQFLEYYERDSHNSFVKVGAETGIVGLYTLLGILVSLYFSLKRFFLTDLFDERKVYVVGFAGYFCSYITASIFSSRPYDVIFLIATAMTGALSRIDFNGSESTHNIKNHKYTFFLMLGVLILWKLFLVNTW